MANIWGGAGTGFKEIPKKLAYEETKLVEIEF